MSNLSLIIGVDEVGRGPLVGDVVAAAVAVPANLDLDKLLPDLNDSKKLSKIKRELLDNKIKKITPLWSIGRSNPKEIDKLNILQASLLAMQRAIYNLEINYNLFLIKNSNKIIIDIDGKYLPNLDLIKKNNVNFVANAIVRGDQLKPHIQAASIIAKVYRDQQMLLLDQQYPDYGFAKHKGYPTKLHLERLAKFGVIHSIYRNSFKPVARVIK